MTQQSPFEDIDPIETQEWLESIDSVMRAQGPERAHFLLEKLVDFTRRSGAYLPFKPNTAYLNTISKVQEPDYPGDRSLERRNEAYIRWNALAMVVQANRVSSEYGGHIASYASAATLYEVAMGALSLDVVGMQERQIIFIISWLFASLAAIDPEHALRPDGLAGPQIYVGAANFAQVLRVDQPFVAYPQFSF